MDNNNNEFNRNKAPFVSRVSDDMLQALDKAAEHLAAQGATVVEQKFKLLDQSFDIWSSMLTSAQVP